jgi:hypothetical protein
MRFTSEKDHHETIGIFICAMWTKTKTKPSIVLQSPYCKQPDPIKLSDMTEDKFIIAAIHKNLDCARISKEGLEGANRQSPDRPISLMSLDARLQVDAATQRGLCYQRFTADLTLKCTRMPPTGANLRCGELTLVILPERKKCWPECSLIQEGLPCPLRDGVRYARVETPGNLCLGEVLRIVKMNQPNGY